MKSIKRNILLLLICCGIILTASQAFSAATGFEDEAGGPQGLAIQGNAPGEKLAGVMFLELYNPHDVYDPALEEDVDGADGYVVVRLRKSNLMYTFYAEIFDVSTLDPRMAQEATMKAMAQKIKEVFFNNDQSVQLVLRNAEEWGSVDGDRSGEIAVECDRGVAFDYTVADIVVAGK